MTALQRKIKSDIRNVNRLLQQHIFKTDGRRGSVCSSCGTCMKFLGAELGLEMAYNHTLVKPKELDSLEDL